MQTVPTLRVLLQHVINPVADIYRLSVAHDVQASFDF